MNSFQNAVYCGIGVGATIGGAMLTAYGVKNLYHLHDIAQERALTEDELTTYRVSMMELIIGTGTCLVGAGVVANSGNIDFALGQNDILRKIKTGKIYVDYGNPQIPVDILENCSKVEPAARKE